MPKNIKDMENYMKRFIIVDTNSDTIKACGVRIGNILVVKEEPSIHLIKTYFVDYETQRELQPYYNKVHGLFTDVWKDTPTEKLIYID